MLSRLLLPGPAPSIPVRVAGARRVSHAPFGIKKDHSHHPCWYDDPKDGRMRGYVTGT
jgi:hypothetical protein